jgi:hypothetical protein
MRLATTDPAQFPAGINPEELDDRVKNLEQAARDLAKSIAQPGDDFQIGVSEALLLSNDGRIQKEFLSDGGDRLVGRLKAIGDPRERIDAAVRAVLSRPSTADEFEILGSFLDDRQDRPAEACRQLVWALLTGSEFRFNY